MLVKMVLPKGEGGEADGPGVTSPSAASSGQKSF
jgi:hypothetical protein